MELDDIKYNRLSERKLFLIEFIDNADFYYVDNRYCYEISTVGWHQLTYYIKTSVISYSSFFASDFGGITTDDINFIRSLIICKINNKQK